MFQILKTSALTVAAAVKDVADELNKPVILKETKIETSGDCIFFQNRLLLTGFPDASMENPNSETFRKDRSLTPFYTPAIFKKYLDEHFKENDTEFVIWNLSGKKYNYDWLNGQVIEYDFPSRPIPPFSVLVELATAINIWLKSSDKNVAIVHDLSGRRAAVVVACVMEILEYYPKESSLRSVANEMGSSGNALVASQIRYYDYFCKYRNTPTVFQPERKLYLRRVIVNGVPDFSNDHSLALNPDQTSCKPFMKVFDSTGNELDCSIIPENPVFGIDVSFCLIPSKKWVLVSNDVLIRFFHYKPESKNEIAMFALSFNVGFVSDSVLRFACYEIDGTAKNPRFPPEMFIDVIFSLEEPKQLEEVKQSKAILPTQDEATLATTLVQKMRIDEAKPQESREASPKDTKLQEIEKDSLKSIQETKTKSPKSKTQSAPKPEKSKSPLPLERDNSMIREIEAALGDDDDIELVLDDYEEDFLVDSDE